MERLSLLVRRSLLIVLTLASSLAAAEPVRQVFLVQNSGWMEPFYLDPSSPFKPLVIQLAAAAAGSSQVVVGGFNQADAQHPSPDWKYRGPGTHAKLAESVNNLTLVRKASGAYADTDFKEALMAAIKTGLEGREGIIWIITNNKNSPNNSSETQLKNREFYDLLHKETVISRIAAFPQKMPVKGTNYQANGLMIYALAYGEKAGIALEQVLAQPALASLLHDDRVRLKPLTQAAVRFIPTGVKDTPDVSAELAADKQTLILNINVDGSPKTAVLLGQFENQFNPYQIHDARIDMRLDMPGEALQSSISLERLTDLEPGARSPELAISMQLPALPSQWSSEVIFSSGYQRAGAIEVRLSEQQLRISQQFIARMNELFPGDALPDVFLPSSEASTSATRLPVELHISYPLGPVLVLFGLFVLLLAAALVGKSMIGGKKPITVMVEGIAQNYPLKPFSSASVYDAQQNKVATLKRGLFGAKLENLAPDIAVRLK
ncbi:hypothetical protein [Pseudomonas fluorescens]|uniref:VWA domain-containing protein n=1 Tax=Pseudomonas fluorescens TaxID=294 RepID=A0A5E7E0U1_PSEFL|nr:hypothetical protein [Pseudomonas fluorescens]VVO15162.1 hypothetical protein PS723_03747 [Pseudomonas fluorescens]